MFDTVRKNASILQVIAADTGQPIIEAGVAFVFENDAEVGCPFCSHKDCFKMFYNEDEPEKGGFHCFSCSIHGDVIKWREKRFSLGPRDAALGLAKDLKIDLPNDYSPIQEIFNLAATYYETCFWETSNKPQVILNKLTPAGYQTDIRKHSEAALKEFHVGWSDGGLIQYLEALGFDNELVVDSGLRKEKDGKSWDFLPRNCFIYPHYVKGRVSHFTFKDPSKKLSYQVPNKYKLNNYQFYGQDTVRNADTIYVVEGENDRISLAFESKAPVIATIGQIGADQIKWLRENCEDKHIVTIFDPDDAGNKYRIKMDKVRNAFKGLTQICPPDDMDIDEYLAKGRSLKELIENNIVEPTVDAEPVPIIPKLPTSIPKQPVVSVAPVEISNENLASRMDAPEEVVVIETEPTRPDKLESGQILLDGGVYYKAIYKDEKFSFKKISDFHIQLKNIYITEDGDRHREVVIVREDGYKSQPILVNSETKVTLKAFKVLLARSADASFRGREDDLEGMWDCVYAQTAETQVNVTRTVGRHEGMKGWIFQNKYMSDSSHVIEPDKDGVFWINGKTVGIRPESLNIASNMSSNNATKEGKNDIPFIEPNVSYEQAEELMGQVVHNLAKNLNDPGIALILLGWIYSCIYSNTIFTLNNSFPFLFFWGTKGKGKTAIAKWLLDFFDMRESGFTSVSQLRSGIGFGRKVEYYSSLPVAIDEIRSDPETKEYLSTFRTYYDRTARTMGVRESFGVKTQAVKSCFMFIGEDQFDDPATRERCIPVRIPVHNRELVESYRWLEDHKHLFSGITFNWILESFRQNPDELKDQIRELDRELVQKAGTSQRTSKNWAAMGIFAQKLCDKYIPEFDFKNYLFEASTSEATFQRSDTTISQFFELAEGMVVQEMPKIGPNHILREGNNLHLWFAPIFNAVADANRGRVNFSKQAILQAIREEPYFLKEGHKVPMGQGQQRRSVITLNYDLCPDNIKNLVPFNMS